MTLVMKKPPPPRMGDVADLAARTDRLGNVEATCARIEKKLDDLARMMGPVASVFGDKGTRVAISAAVTTQAMRALRK
jgi:hypothetical protein